MIIDDLELIGGFHSVEVPNGPLQSVATAPHPSNRHGGLRWWLENVSWALPVLDRSQIRIYR